MASKGEAGKAYGTIRALVLILIGAMVQLFDRKPRDAVRGVQVLLTKVFGRIDLADIPQEDRPMRGIAQVLGYSGKWNLKDDGPLNLSEIASEASEAFERAVAAVSGGETTRKRRRAVKAEPEAEDAESDAEGAEDGEDDGAGPKSG